MLKTPAALTAYIEHLDEEIAEAGARWTKAKRQLVNDRMDARRELRFVLGRAA